MSRESRLDCLVAGDANVDLLLEGLTQIEEGTEKLATGMNLTLGGSSTITAANLARMGTRVGFAGVVGKDAFGTLVETELRAAGVHLAGLKKSVKEKTGLTVWCTNNGARAGVTYQGTIATMRTADVPLALLKRSRHLHVGAYFLLTGFHKTAAALFRRARGLGLTTSLDCNYDPAERWDSGIQNVLRYTDIFLPNDDEAKRLTNTSDAEQAASALGKLARVVAVKCGARGAVIATPEGMFSVPAKRAKVVDTTGAGDSFNAGFLHAFLKGESWRESAMSGVRAGALCVSHSGGTTAFTRGI